MKVVNARDEELGSVDRIFKNAGNAYVIVLHGSWSFGLNDKEIAFAASDAALHGDQMLLKGLTEEQIEAMPDYDYNSEEAVASNETLDVTVLNQ